MLCPLRLDIDKLSIDGSPWAIDEALVKTHCRIDFDDDDANLQAYVESAVLWAENFTHRTIIRREHRWTLAEFPYDGRLAIRLPRGKCSAVSGIVYSLNGAATTLRGPTSSPVGTDWQEDLTADAGGVLMPPRGASWPSADIDVPAPVVFDFTAGYDAAEIPADLLNAVLMACADAWDIRGSGDSIDMAGKRLQSRESLASSYMLPRIY